MFKVITFRSATLFALLLITGLVAHAQSASESKSTPSAEIKFGKTGIKSNKGEVEAGAAFGDLSKGGHGTFLKIPAGFATPLHTHTEDYYAIVIKGTVVNALPGKKDVPLNAGSHWFQKGGEAHVTKCISKTLCETFFSQNAKFDFLPAK